MNKFQRETAEIIINRKRTGISPFRSAQHFLLLLLACALALSGAGKPRIYIADAYTVNGRDDFFNSPIRSLELLPGGRFSCAINGKTVYGRWEEVAATSLSHPVVNLYASSDDTIWLKGTLSGDQRAGSVTFIWTRSSQKHLERLCITSAIATPQPPRVCQ